MKFRERYLVLAVGVVSLLVLAAGCGGQNALEEGGGGGGFVVGSANFPEQLILGNMYADVIEDQGIEVERRLNLGTRDVLFPSLESGEITLVPEYNGALLSYLSKGESDVTSPEETTKLLKKELPEGLISLEASEAQDKDALVVTPETAEKYDLENTSDLAPVADELIVGGPPEMSERPDGLPGLKRVYGIEFEEFKALDAGGPLTTEALGNGDVDVGRFFSSQGLIDARGWIVLEDNKELSPAQNIIPIIRKQDSTGKIVDALNELSATLTTEDLKKLNRRVEVDKEDPEDVAKDYLKQKGLLG
ncbi:MAG: ABC transporter substrate-binding protein [Rubrobacteraceae bacterium]|nr:ABC transporter substrate-binding protein [Rubrobacteraceae bacterium]